MLFAEKFFHFREKYHISGNFFRIYEKMWYIRKMFLVCPENFFEMTSPPPPVANISGKKFLGALFAK
jgi:hypothetical protein